MTKVAAAGGAPVVLASGQPGPGGIALGADAVYWANTGCSADAGTCMAAIMKLPR